MSQAGLFTIFLFILPNAERLGMCHNTCPRVSVLKICDLFCSPGAFIFFTFISFKSKLYQVYNTI